MSKPTEVPRWATDETNNAAPSTVQMDTGWTVGQDGISSYDNWFKQRTYLWLDYLDSILETDGVISNITPESGASVILSGGGRYKNNTLVPQLFPFCAFVGQGIVQEPTLAAAVTAADASTKAVAPISLDPGKTIHTVRVDYLVGGGPNIGVHPRLKRQQRSDPTIITDVWAGVNDITAGAPESQSSGLLTHVIDENYWYYWEVTLAGTGNRLYGASITHYHV